MYRRGLRVAKEMVSSLPTEATEENSRGGVHTVKWPFQGLKVTVSKLREQSNGGLLADFDLKWQTDSGRPWGPLLGAPLNLGYWFWNRNPPGNKELPIDAVTEQSRPYPHPL